MPEFLGNLENLQLPSNNISRLWVSPALNTSMEPCPRLEIMGAVSTVKEGVQFILDNPFDLVFLDAYGRGTVASLECHD